MEQGRGREATRYDARRGPMNGPHVPQHLAGAAVQDYEPTTAKEVIIEG